MHTVAPLTWSPLISGHLPASFDIQIYLYVNWGENKLYPHVHPLSSQLEPMSGYYWIVRIIGLNCYVVVQTI